MNKTTLPILALLVISGLILSACGSTGSPASLAGSSWNLVSYGPGKGQIPAASGIETHVDFGGDGRVSGSVGCNSFSGDYKVKNGSIIFGQIMSTMMACAEPQMTQESTALQVMTGTVRFQLEDDTLILYAAGGDSAITLSKMAE
jgi:heat shock protein HslJ